jgi:hypothetical protein
VSAISNINLIVATLQLELVQSLVGAIRKADAESAAQLSAGRALAEGRDRYCPGPITPGPRYLPRPVIHPTPRYLPRPVIHPTPRVAPQCPPPSCPRVKAPEITPAPPPPWKILPGQEPALPPNVIKIFIRQPDIVGKGALIDLFL